MTASDEDELRNLLGHVFWLGGGSGGGKSTIARRLAEVYNLQVYATDDSMQDHHRRCPPADCPLLTAFAAMPMDQRWVTRSPQEMLDTFHWYQGEVFDLILDDLLALPAGRRVIVEGFRLLPHLVAPLLTDRRQAAWLLPTPDFRRAAFTSRATLWQIPNKTTDPQRALSNLLERDAMFTSQLRDTIRELGLVGIDVDVTSGGETLELTAATALGLRGR